MQVIMIRYVINTHGKNLQVAFPSLETLTILHIENLKIILHDQLVENHMTYSNKYKLAQ